MIATRNFMEFGDVQELAARKKYSPPSHIIPTLRRSLLYTSPVKHKIVVIPAWMPETSAMDGNFLAPQTLNRREKF